MGKRFSLLLILLCLSHGCSFFKRRGDWGKKAIWPVSGSRVSRAFIKNIKSPHVWLPAAGAGLIQLSGQDKKMSSWGSENNPIFGSQRNASDMSDVLNNVLIAGSGTSIFFPASWNGSEGDYLGRKVKGGLVVFTSLASSEMFNNSVRQFVKRERPNGRDMRSLPSGHATVAGANAAILRRNVETSGMNPTLISIANGVNTTLAAGVLWARVEAKAHYTTDVLVGYGVGNFVSGFLFDSLMNLEPNETVSLYPNEYKGMTLSYALAF